MMKVRKVLIVILVAAISFGFYRFYHHQKSSKMKDNQEILVQPIKPKQSKTKVKRNVTKEAKAILEEPEERVNQKEAEQVKAAIQATRFWERKMAMFGFKQKLVMY